MRSSSPPSSTCSGDKPCCAQTILPHPAFGMCLQQLEEVAHWELDRFKGFAARSQPCVLRGIAADWPMVVQGRFQDNVQLLRRRLGNRRCLVSFDPTASFFNYEIPGSFQTKHHSVREPPGADAPRLINPGRLEMKFGDFLTAAELKHGVVGPTKSAARVVSMPYDADDADAGRDFEAVQDVLYVQMKELQQLSLYCVDDAADWPEDLLQEFVHGDLTTKLDMPEWQPFLRERRLWMCAGGPEAGRSNGTRHLTAGFHWDHLQNLHAVISGKKEVFLVAPLQAPALYGTRFSRQAQWNMSTSEHGRILLEKCDMQSIESTSDYTLVSIDRLFEENSLTHPAMVEEMKEPVARAMLYPGDAIYIPPGWWHSVRTWQPQAPEALPFSMSVNFWYALTPEATAAQRSVLLTLEVLSCQQALAGLPEEHISKLLKPRRPLVYNRTATAADVPTTISAGSVLDPSGGSHRISSGPWRL
eukprot:s4352_g5.t4